MEHKSVPTITDHDKLTPFQHCHDCAVGLLMGLSQSVSINMKHNSLPMATDDDRLTANQPCCNLPILKYLTTYFISIQQKLAQNHILKHC